MLQVSKLVRSPWALGLALCLCVSCRSRVGFHPGTQCDLNTECASPLVCRLGYCRLECRSQRDCGAGLTCVRDDDGLGACQLPEETDCTLDSDCPSPLVCRARSCTNACEDSRDCPPGSVCGEDATGARGCRDDAEADCALNTDCPDALVCAVDHRCRVQCRVDRDCAPELVCADWMDPPRCVPPDAPRPDTGVDAGMDTGTGDTGAGDTGAGDTGAGDTGMADTAVADTAVADTAVADTAVADTAAADTAVADTGVLDSGAVDSGSMPTGFAGTDVLVAGFAHSCGALSFNDLRCWGDNSNAQLGDGSSTARTTPVSVALTGVERLAAGNGHSCAVTTSGLYCWGDNRRGQVGAGSTATKIGTPTRLTGLTGVRDLAAGKDHVCALTATGVSCWGANDRGQLGDGSTTDRNAPVPVVGLASVPVAIAARGTHTCALLASGTMQCWGDNQFGELGDGSTTTAAVTRPVDVAGLSGAVRVAAGTSFTCAVDRLGKVRCWGDGSFGTLGDGSFGTRTSPGTPVSLAGNAVEIAAGVRHVCVLTDTAQVFCWGDNAKSQLGQPAFSPLSSATPIEIAGLVNPLEVNAGQSHSCARESTRIRCWGDNTFHQLGNGGSTPSTSPVTVSWP